MSKYQKTLQKIQRTPTPSDVRWSDLVALLDYLGFELRSGKGSRRKFIHRQTAKTIICHEPHPQPIVAKWMLENIVQMLRDSQII
ncbi:type II toxin-antitoxin system HicA family toxin [Orrella daihaiensis]|uniref:Type II toxin-antitoxin system HicA family toxin n=1 Tax=Orrella daihaiensis TaxID=2782176 RepID=A0ABY4AQJ3_9BURK|nr:type II toxin-antitoxin system HicA family toxin [Orrella daihaiensis]